MRASTIEIEAERLGFEREGGPQTEHILKQNQIKKKSEDRKRNLLSCEEGSRSGES